MLKASVNKMICSTYRRLFDYSLGWHADDSLVAPNGAGPTIRIMCLTNVVYAVARNVGVATVLVCVLPSIGNAVSDVFFFFFFSIICRHFSPRSHPLLASDYVLGVLWNSQQNSPPSTHTYV